VPVLWHEPQAAWFVPVHDGLVFDPPASVEPWQYTLEQVFA
jgi:hypothetical protein